MPLRLSDRTTMLPVIHGSGDFSNAVRQYLLHHRCDCLAVPLPASFQEDVQRAVEHLPTPTIVSQRNSLYNIEWTPASDRASTRGGEGDLSRVSYVPVDPCQPVIAALRLAAGERIRCKFIDLECADFHAETSSLPDPYALKKVSLEQFAAAVLPSLRRPTDGLTVNRIRHMATRLRELEQSHESIVLICAVQEWPWIREAYFEQLKPAALDDEIGATQIHAISAETLMFVLGELPFITSLYERTFRTGR